MESNGTNGYRQAEYDNIKAENKITEKNYSFTPLSLTSNSSQLPQQRPIARSHHLPSIRPARYNKACSMPECWYTAAELRKLICGRLDGVGCAPHTSIRSSRQAK
ncbi:hypothetical protein IG631_13402 [Alternaria alternata]|nr:hypothetical protein IG631_13402 [Alternaria alternata]